MLRGNTAEEFILSGPKRKSIEAADCVTRAIRRLRCVGTGRVEIAAGSGELGTGTTVTPILLPSRVLESAKSTTGHLSAA